MNTFNDPNASGQQQQQQQLQATSQPPTTNGVQETLVRWLSFLLENLISFFL